MSKPRLLDLFCCAGGAAMGYHRAGFEVVGVDIAPQPRYPFEFHQADAMTFPLDGFDAIHASPPCQAYSMNLRGLVTKDYPELIEPTQARLEASGMPWVIENVVGAILPSAIILCGMTFGLSMHRHRLFQTGGFAMLAPPCIKGDKAQTRDGRAYSPYDKDSRESWGVGKGKGGAALLMAQLMEVEWMHGQEISEAIPPAYTEYIGRQLMAVLTG
jgi:DNA (cytosine-5)-methyltransferase 1